MPTACAHIGRVLAISHHHLSTPDGLLRVIYGDGNVTSHQQHCGQLGGVGVPPTSTHIGQLLAITLQHLSLGRGLLQHEVGKSLAITEVLADHS